MLPDMEKNTSSRKWIWLEKKKKKRKWIWLDPGSESMSI